MNVTIRLEYLTFRPLLICVLVSMIGRDEGFCLQKLTLTLPCQARIRQPIYNMFIRKTYDISYNVGNLMRGGHQ